MEGEGPVPNLWRKLLVGFWVLLQIMGKMRGSPISGPDIPNQPRYAPTIPSLLFPHTSSAWGALLWQAVLCEALEFVLRD